MIRIALAALVCLAFAAALVFAVLARPLRSVNLPAQVADAVPDAGASHPVTAVLLDFRAYDTLLEVAVLLVAVVIAIALREAQPDGPDRLGVANPLLRAVMGMLLPLMLLVSAYLLWAGSTRPGGAFHAGAVLASAGVLLRLAGVRLGLLEHAARLRFGLALGLMVFLVVGACTLLSGRAFLEYPKHLAGAAILAIELFLTLSIALALLSLFRLAPPQTDEPRFPDRRSERRP